MHRKSPKNQSNLKAVGNGRSWYQPLLLHIRNRPLPRRANSWQKSVISYQSKFTSHTNPITRFIFLFHSCSPVSIILKRGLGIIQYNTPLPTKRGLCSVVNNRKCFDQSVYHIYKRHPEICSHS